MDDGVKKSCWGVTAWAVAGFVCLVALALLVGGGVDGAAVLAAS